MQFLQRQKRKAILLIDDDKGVRAAISQVIASDAFDLLEADRAETAVRVWNKRKDDIILILLDVMLPGLSGPELAEEFLRENPRAPIVFVTGVAKHFLPRFKIPPQMPILHKPFAPEELKAVIAEALAKAV